LPSSLFSAMKLAAPYLSVIAPIAIYQILQDVAAVAGAAAAGDDYDPRAVLAWDGLGTLVCGLAGSVITPVIYAMHPPYKAIGARIAFAFWTPVAFLAIAVSGVTMFVAQLFPWPILAAIIAYVSIGVGMATMRRVDPKYWAAVLLGFVLPAGAVVSTAMNSALPALHLSSANLSVQAALDRTIYWSSIQGLGNGFLFLVLVVASVVAEAIDRRFTRAAIWCLVAAAFSWLGLMHSAVIQWGARKEYAAGWLAAAVIVWSARWWGGLTPSAR
jgi:AGZA family xanthine/uracil permease-like MFS transporter